MSETVEHAKEAIEHAHHEAEHSADRFPRNVAILVAVLAAALAMAEMGEKGAQNAYLTHHIAASDDWSFYQAKNIRANVYNLHADLLESLPNGSDPAIRKKAEAARAEAKRLDDDEKANGRKQLAVKARDSERQRDNDFHRYHLFEVVVGALQISIVLASVSIVSRMKPLALLAGAIGLASAGIGVAVALNLI